MNSSTITAVDWARAIHEEWRRPVRLFRAPGRVNLIGEHTDYNDGFVLPAAIRFSTFVTAAGRADRLITIRSEHYPDAREFDLDALPGTAENLWSDYAAGVILSLVKAGVQLSGADLLIRGEVPIGSGLSSSASFEVAVGLTLSSLSGANLDRTQLASLCQSAERDFVGVRVGIMDQFVSAHAHADTALFLDCRSLAYKLAPLSPAASLVICNSNVHHSLASSEYNRRREECEEGARTLGVRALRDVAPEELERKKHELPSVIYRRCRHVVNENQRVIDAVARLTDHDLAGFGELMYASHRSLRDDYEVSCSELDSLVAIASSLPGVYGARMTGGGFGGCTVNLVQREFVDSFRAQIQDKYLRAVGKETTVYVTEAVEGAEEISVG